MNECKTKKSRLLLEEENGIVKASFIDKNDLSLQRIIHDMPYPRVRAPRKSKNQIIKNSEFMAKVHHETQEEFLRKNIGSMNQEINKHIQEIRKTLKRMQSFTHYVVTAQEILDEME